MLRKMIVFIGFIAVSFLPHSSYAKSKYEFIKMPDSSGPGSFIPNQNS